MDFGKGISRGTNKLFVSNGMCFPGRTINFPSNKIATVTRFSMMKQKMGRTRRKSGMRKTVDCLLSCLNRKMYPLVLKWKNRKEKIFSILFKHKKSCTWKPEYLAFFKELDGLSVNKLEKYQQESDADQACKRRCKANLRKLCQDGVLELVEKNEIDKTTKEIYYKFSGLSANDETVTPIILLETRLKCNKISLESPSKGKSHFSCLSNSSSNGIVEDQNIWVGNNLIAYNTQFLNNDIAAFEQTYGDSEQTNVECNDYNEDGSSEQFYSPEGDKHLMDNVWFDDNIYLLSAMEKNDFDPTLSNCNSDMYYSYDSEERGDINDLLEMIDGNKETPFLSDGDPMISG